MSDYTPSGKPQDNVRYTAKMFRAEYALIQEAINSKSDKLSKEATSATSLLIGLGQKTLTVDLHKDFNAGDYVRIADDAAPSTNYMSGMVDSYDEDEGELVVTITSITGSGTKTAWIVTITSPDGVTLENNNFTGHQNFAYAIVPSHATTAGIWAAPGNMIQFTGSATVTAFPAATQAGSERTLIGLGGVSFTAGANMLIDGLASGETVLCATNDMMIVRAITTTQFRLTRVRYDGGLPGNHVVTLSGGNGYGSDINSNIPKFLTIVENVGTALSYSNSSTAGLSVTINETAFYEVFYQFYYSSANIHSVGVSINSAQLTTSVLSITAAKVMIFQVGNSALAACSRTIKLTAGDVIRPHHNSTSTPNTQALTVFSVRKVANA